MHASLTIPTPGHDIQTPVPHAAGGGWITLRQALARMAPHQHGWDGPGSLAPAATALEHAFDFTRALEVQGVALPGLHGDGEIAFSWIKAEAAASVAFPRDLSIIAVVRAPNGERLCQIDTFHVSQADLSALFEALRQAF